jgi:hypothetical protein
MTDMAGVLQGMTAEQVDMFLFEATPEDASRLLAVFDDPDAVRDDLLRATWRLRELGHPLYDEAAQRYLSDPRTQMPGPLGMSAESELTSY